MDVAQLATDASVWKTPKRRPPCFIKLATYFLSRFMVGTPHWGATLPTMGWPPQKWWGDKRCCGAPQFFSQSPQLPGVRGEIFSQTTTSSLPANVNGAPKGGSSLKKRPPNTFLWLKNARLFLSEKPFAQKKAKLFAVEGRRKAPNVFYLGPNG